MAGCAEQVSNRLYTNTMYGFSLNPPVGWQSAENESSDIAVRFTPFNYSNVSLRITPPFSLSEGRALSTFADVIEENLSESGMNYKIVYRDWRAMERAQAYEIVYSYKQDGTAQQIKQVAVLKTRLVYLITFTAPSDLYIQYITGVDQYIDSFR
jgi:PsbP-like protein